MKRPTKTLVCACFALALGFTVVACNELNDLGHNPPPTAPAVVIAPQAGFRHVVVPPMAVDVTDTTSGAPQIWKWDFGDGTGFVFDKNPPIHTYVLPGTYTIVLEVENAGGKSSDSALVTVPAP